jgi:fluoride exporter
MTELLLVALGGAIGAVARYVVGTAVQSAAGGPFPLGTLSVNVLGCFLIGVLGAMFAVAPGHPARLFLITGVLGGFTTFSSFGFETLNLLRSGAVGLVLGNMLLSNIGGLLAAAAGYALSARLR